MGAGRDRSHLDARFVVTDRDRNGLQVSISLVKAEGWFDYVDVVGGQMTGNRKIFAKGS